MSQNIYDDNAFFTGYTRLPRSVQGLAGAPEWPALRALLPPLAGAAVLDLGCGFGWFCRWAREHGAAHVLGIDLSEKMLARARETTRDPGIDYLRADMEAPELPERQFGLVYSSLALHYVENLPGLIRQVSRALLPGGVFVCSVEHPIYTAPRRPAWIADMAGRQVWPVDSYLSEGPRSTDWLAKGVIKQHRTVATYLNLLIGAGLTLAHVEEWGPSQGQIAGNPALAPECERPPLPAMGGAAVTRRLKGTGLVFLPRLRGRWRA